MSSSDESSESEWSRSSDQKKETKLKPHKIINGDKKYYRQRFVDRWLDRFKPWIAKDEANPEKAYCKACKRLLGAKFSELQRHEQAVRHNRNLQSYMHANGILPDPEHLFKHKKRKNAVKVGKSRNAGESKFESIFLGNENVDGDKHKPTLDGGSSTQGTTNGFQFTQDEVAVELENENQASTSNLKKRHTTKQTKRKENAKKGKNLFLQIQKDRHELMSSFNDLLAVEKKDKNNVDVFFESIISSVKALSPKLIVETKMRICQLICEMELRTITENESNSLASSTAPTILLSAPLDSKFIFAQQGDTASEMNQVGSSQNDQAHDEAE